MHTRLNRSRVSIIAHDSRKHPTNAVSKLGYTGQATLESFGSVIVKVIVTLFLSLYSHRWKIKISQVLPV